MKTVDQKDKTDANRKTFVTMRNLGAGTHLGASTSFTPPYSPLPEEALTDSSASPSSWVRKVSGENPSATSISAAHDVPAQYNTYFKGGATSIYNARFGENRVLPRERYILEQSFKRVSSALETAGTSDSPFKIWDFGCGDGRLWPVYRDIAGKLAATGREVEFIAYDPSREGLHCFQQMLLQQGARFVGENKLGELDTSLPEGARGYVAAEMALNNIRIRFVHSDIHDSRAHTESLVGTDHQMIATMFGSFAHVAGQKTRQEHLQMFQHVLHDEGEFLLNVPTPKSFEKELALYSELRAQYRGSLTHHLDEHVKRLDAIANLIPEEGDIYYCKFGKQNGVANYYHIFTGAELTTEMKKAGLVQKGDIEISSIDHPSHLSRSWAAAKADEWLSWMWPARYAPYQWTEKTGNYLLAVAGKGGVGNGR